MSSVALDKNLELTELWFPISQAISWLLHQCDKYLRKHKGRLTQSVGGWLCCFRVEAWHTAAGGYGGKLFLMAEGHGGKLFLMAARKQSDRRVRDETPC